VNSTASIVRRNIVRERALEEDAMNRARGRGIIFVLLASLIFPLASPAFGQGVMNPYGQPQIVVRGQPSYYVWVDQTGWHLRWSTPVPVTLSGSVTTNGLFSGICPSGPNVAGGLSFYGSNRAVFSIPVRAGIGGFDFRTSGGLVTFDLGVNGIPVSGGILPWLIYIGQNLVPSLRSFTLSATPAFVQAACRESYLGDVDRPVKDPDR
jgi:hypothetical protein